MAIFVDDMRTRARVGTVDGVWSHLYADRSDELVRFAARLGLSRNWIQCAGDADEHFDVTEPKRLLAVQLGAQAISCVDGGLLVARKAIAMHTQTGSGRSDEPGGTDVFGDIRGGEVAVPLESPVGTPTVSDEHPLVAVG